LQHHLEAFPGCVILVTHDRYFLDLVTKWTLELDRGKGHPHEGNYSSWLEQKMKRLEQEEKQESKRQRALKRELEWARKGPKGRQSKGKARLNNYEAMMAEDIKEKESRVEIPIPNGPRLGKEVIEAVDVAKGYDDRLLFENMNFNLPQAGIVGVIGPNGAGKTTLFRMVMGEEQPDRGELKIGDTVKIGYVDQRHADIDPEKTVFEVISGGHEVIEIGGQSINARAYVSRFNFSGADQQKKVGVLSGGERNRLHLAMTLKTEANVMLLDEPTNDIDVNTLRALEEGIENFAGCAVVVSHDRWFLDRICTHILAFEGDSSTYFFEGSFSEYEENRRKRLGRDIIPKRLKYKRLTR
jgi:ATP-binding cassette ChvD family protein